MQEKRSFEWAQGREDEVTGLSKEQRETQACQRRLRQMEAKREKAEQKAQAGEAK